MTQLRKKHGLLDTTPVPHAMIILTCTAVGGIPQMLRHRYTENYQDIPFSEISRKLYACALLCVPGVPPCPSSKLELERLGMRLHGSVLKTASNIIEKSLPFM